MEYNLAHIARIVGGIHLGVDARAKSVITDSRHSFDAEREPLFVAIEGANHDGHRFVAELYQRGVRAFMVEHRGDWAENYPEAGFVVVARSLVALQRLAAHHRAEYKGTVVAIAGSWGKTVVKEWIALAAPEGVKVFRSPKSYNSQLGVALSLLMMEGDEELAVIETGISRVGEMARLEAMVRPDVGLFTHIGPQHDENFRSVAEKVAEKAALFGSAREVFYVAGESGEVDSHFATMERARAVDNDRRLVAELYALLGYDAERVLRLLADAVPADLRVQIAEGLGDSVVVSDTHTTDLNSLAIALEKLQEVALDRPRVLILSDICYSSLEGEELYGRVIRLVRQAGVSSLIGIGGTISRHRELFERGDVPTLLYGSVEDFLKGFRLAMVEGAAVLVGGGPQAGFERVVHHLSRRSHTTVLEVNLSAMVRNLNLYRQMLPTGHRLMAMVKASSYGHGDYEIAATLAHEGVDYLAVAFADEGVLLRQKGIAMPIVVLNADADSFELMVSYRLEPEIYNRGSLEAFAQAVRRAGQSRYPIHLKIDSGMHRLGFERADVEGLCDRLCELKGLVTVRSMFSHFATADQADEADFVRHQQQRFAQTTDAIIARLGYVPLRHINNTAAMEHYPSSAYDMCRLGIGLYGVGAEGVSPISRLVTRIVQLKRLEAGETVGYGRQGRVQSPMRVATIPIGYADGLDRRCGCGAWSVSVCGVRCPIVGRVCMDSCMVDVTAVEACKEGDEVTIFGGEGGSVEDMAALLGTIPYEVMTSISTRVKRIFVTE